MTPDTQLSEAVRVLENEANYATGFFQQTYEQSKRLKAHVRTVLDELERRDEIIGRMVAEAQQKFEDSPEGKELVAFRLAALRSAPRFTQEDVDFLAQCERDETNGVHGFTNEYAAAKFRDLADRISQHLEGK